MLRRNDGWMSTTQYTRRTRSTGECCSSSSSTAATAATSRPALIRMLLRVRLLDLPNGGGLRDWWCRVGDAHLKARKTTPFHKNKHRFEQKKDECLVLSRFSTVSAFLLRCRRSIVLPCCFCELKGTSVDEGRQGCPPHRPGAARAAHYFGELRRGAGILFVARSARTLVTNNPAEVAASPTTTAPSGDEQPELPSCTAPAPCWPITRTPVQQPRNAYT